jgi:ParB family chromosome partitioning protein
MNPKPPQRRGLGRGLGSLIPTAPRHEQRDRDDEPVALRPDAETDHSGQAVDDLSLARGRHALLDAPPQGDTSRPREESADADDSDSADVAGTSDGIDGADGMVDVGGTVNADGTSRADDSGPPSSGVDEWARAHAASTPEPSPAADTVMDSSAGPADESAGHPSENGATTAVTGTGAAGEGRNGWLSGSGGPGDLPIAPHRGNLRPAVPGVADWIGVPLLTDVLGRTAPGSTQLPEDSTDEHRGATNLLRSPSTGPSVEGAGPAVGVPAAVVGIDTGSSSGSEVASGSTTDDGLRPVSGAWFAELSVADISPNPRQPREVFDEESMAELVQSILEVGLLQPVVVRPVDGDRYELVMGERRWRATQLAGLDTIPAIVRETGDDALLRDALLENLHRSQLNSLEEAAAYQQLLEDFGCTHDELAARLGRSRPQISNTIRLLKLSPAVQRRVAAGVLSAGHARALLAVEDPEVQDRLAGRVVAEGISVRGLEELVAVGDLGSGPGRGPRRARPTAPGVEDLAARLSDRLDTRVKVELGKRKGRITVEFASQPDLERIVAMIDPGHTTRTHRDD